MSNDDWKKETSKIGQRRPSRKRKTVVIEEPGAEPNVPEGPSYLKRMKAEIEEFKQKMAVERQKMLDEPSLAGKEDTPWELDEERMMKKFEDIKQQKIRDGEVNLRPKGARNAASTGERNPLPARGSSQGQHMNSIDSDRRDYAKFDDEFDAIVREMDELKAEAAELRLDIKRKSLEVSKKLKNDAKEGVRAKKEGKYPSEWDPAAEAKKPLPKDWTTERGSDDNEEEKEEGPAEAPAEAPDEAPPADAALDLTGDAEAAAGVGAEAAEGAGAAALNSGVLAYALTNAEVLGVMSATQTAAVTTFLASDAVGLASASLGGAAAVLAAYALVGAAKGAMTNTQHIVSIRKARYAAAERVQSIVHLHKTDPVRYGLFVADPAYRKRVLADATSHANTQFDHMSSAAQVGSGSYSPAGDPLDITPLQKYMRAGSELDTTLTQSDEAFFRSWNGTDSVYTGFKSSSEFYDSLGTASQSRIVSGRIVEPESDFDKWQDQTFTGTGTRTIACSNTTRSHCSFSTACCRSKPYRCSHSE